MKLAEALAERAHLQRRLEEAKNRLCASVRFRQGEEMLEDPMALLDLIDATTESLRDYLAQINHTNIAVRAPDGRTLTELIAARDAALARFKTYKSAWEKLSGDDRTYYSDAQAIMKRALAPAVLRERMDKAGLEWHRLNRVIQRLNWEAELASAP